jgi:DNA-binding winged helix-turn-helix (wHTH) protein/TolA-binding protein
MLLSPSDLYRFDEFELAPGRRVLLRNEEPILLTPKAFEVLAYLVLNPGRVVTKDELLKAVWPDSFVEEGNLAQYISALRRALGNKSSLIVTVPGQGYQFAAQVFADHVPSEIPGNALTEQLPGDIYVQRVRERTRVVYEDRAAQLAQPDPALLGAGAASRRARFWQWGSSSVLACALIALAAVHGWKRFAHPPPLSDVVLADFTNDTGDAAFDHSLGQVLEIDLAQSPFLNLLSGSTVNETLVQMQRKTDEALTPELAREVCERNNAQAVLHGAIANVGKEYLLTLAADSCVNGKQVAGYKVEANSREEVLRALDTVAGHVRQQLGESAASLEQFQTPIEQATTSSLEALRAYSLAQDNLDRIEPRAALALYQRAVALDPGFASGYYGIGASYYRLSDTSQAALNIKKAFDLRKGATQRERLDIEIAYHYFGDYDAEAAVRSLKLFIETYPKSSVKSWANLCGLYTRLGDYAQAIAAGEQALRMDPHSIIRAEMLSRAYMRANRFADARRVASLASAVTYAGWGVHSIMFQVAFAERDETTLKAETAWGLSHPQLDRTLYNLALAAATSGRLREATEFFSQSQAESVRDGDAGFADEAQRGRARVLVEYGEVEQARKLLKVHSEDANDPGDLADLQAQTGDVAAARLFVAASSSLAEKNTFRIYCDLPLVRAQLALQAHKPLDAIQRLEPARTYQLRDFNVPYLRAQAETEAGLLDAAAGDYRIILANQGVDPISPLYPLAHLRLARVLALQSNKAGSKSEYEKLFALWKDADSGLHVGQEARIEYSRLK